jgi:cation:H+ antiporter
LPWSVLLVIFGLGLTGLTLGGDWLCRGAVSLAAVLKIRPVIIGLTVVSIATSMPELFTSLISALSGNPGVAIGNIVGSNVANIGLILAISALICPLIVRTRLIRIDVPILIGVSLLFTALCWNSISRLDGIILLAVCFGYFFFLLRSVRSGAPVIPLDAELEETYHGASLVTAGLWIFAGTVALAVGADLLVRSSVEAAARLGVSDVLIGVTVVAVGTSLPELAASVAAALRRQADLCAGNIVGSNLFNLILIAGAVAVVHPIDVQRRMFIVEFPAMLIFAVLMWPFFFTGKKVSRPEGVALLLLYGLFVILSIFSQTGRF